MQHNIRTNALDKYTDTIADKLYNTIKDQETLQIATYDTQKITEQAYNEVRNNIKNINYTTKLVIAKVICGKVLIKLNADLSTNQDSANVSENPTNTNQITHYLIRVAELVSQSDSEAVINQMQNDESSNKALSLYQEYKRIRFDQAFKVPQNHSAKEATQMSDHTNTPDTPAANITGNQKHSTEQHNLEPEIPNSDTTINTNFETPTAPSNSTGSTIKEPKCLLDYIKKISKEVYDQSEHCTPLHSKQKVTITSMSDIRLEVTKKLQDEYKIITDDKQNTIANVICGAALLQCMDNSSKNLIYVKDIENQIIDVNSASDFMKNAALMYYSYITVASIVLCEQNNQKNQDHLMEQIYRNFYNAEDVKHHCNINDLQLLTRYNELAQKFNKEVTKSDTPPTQLGQNINTEQTTSNDTQLQ